MPTLGSTATSGGVKSGFTAHAMCPQGEIHASVNEPNSNIRRDSTSPNSYSANSSSHSAEPNVLRPSHDTIPSDMLRPNTHRFSPKTPSDSVAADAPHYRPSTAPFTESWHFIPSCCVTKIGSIPSCTRRSARTMYIPNQVRCGLVDQLMRSSSYLISRSFLLPITWTASMHVTRPPSRHPAELHQEWASTRCRNAVKYPSPLGSRLTLKAHSPPRHLNRRA